MKKVFLTVFLLILVMSFMFIFLRQNRISPPPDSIQGNTKFKSFNQTKSILLKQVYNNHRITFYCQETFNKKKRLTSTKKFKSKLNNKRSKKIEWEHIVPANAFGKNFKAWTEGNKIHCVKRKSKAKGKKYYKGRKCAAEVSKLYQFMQADMHNLVPAIGEINGLRSNYEFVEHIQYGPKDKPDQDGLFKKCKMNIDNQQAIPPPKTRGNIARTYFYMRAAYPEKLKLSVKQVKLLEKWNKKDPVNKWECQRTKTITKIQGNPNPFVEKPCIDNNFW